LKPSIWKARPQPSAWWRAARGLLPSPQGVADLWRDWRAAHRRPIVLRPYVDLHSRWRLAARFLVPLGVGLFCIIYGFFFAITAPYLLLPLAAPIAVLGLLAIWALPEHSVVPTRGMELAFSALLIGLVLWPNYLALALPGLPWITMVRLTGFPMAFMLLISLSVSQEFRGRILWSTTAAPMVFRMFLAFTALEFITLPFSKHISESLNQVVIQQLNWTAVFLVSLYIFRKEGRVERYLLLLLALAIPIMVIAVLEVREGKVLWSGHVPGFLRVEDPTAQLALSASIRGATGLYRAKGTFSTPLGLSEYLALMTPFALHWAVGRYNIVLRLAALALVPTLYFVIRLTDARLGVIGYLVSCLIYLLLWSLVRWRRRMSDLLTAAIVYAYPSVFLATVAAVLFVHRIHLIVFGGGAQEASNEARSNQYRMALPALLRNPIGHGSGESGSAMGYSAGQFVAIDSYYLSLALDYGFIGLILFVAMFTMVIGAAVTTVLRNVQSSDREAGLLLPLATCLSAFLVIRGVFQQPDILPMIYMMVGMVIALVARARAEEAKLPDQAAVGRRPGEELAGGRPRRQRR
jgi:hypothetical protein